MRGAGGVYQERPASWAVGRLRQLTAGRPFFVLGVLANMMAAAALVMRVMASREDGELMLRRLSFDDYSADDEDDTSMRQEVIFVIIIAAILCCGCTCLSTNSCTTSSNMFGNDITEPLLTRDEERRGVFANSLIAEENEWLCPVCAFENKPRAGACAMCSTPRETASQYYDAMRKQAPHEADEMGFRVTIVAPGGRILDDDDDDDDDLKGDDFVSSGEGAGATWKPRASMRHFERESMRLSHNATTVSGADPADLAGPESGALNNNERQQAFMIRRFNTLTLRQRAAHRRRLWQRRLNPSTGALEWVRMSAPAAKTSPGATSNVTRSSFGYSKADPDFDDIDEAPREGGDSFGDNALLSHSPGFTSVLDESNPGTLGWQEVSGVSEDSVGPIKKRILEQSKRMASHERESDVDIQDLLTSDDFAAEDLETIAAMPFRRKHQWFQSNLDALRSPETTAPQGGRAAVVTINVRRDHLLPDSYSQIMALEPAHLHRRLRVRFKGEPGIDAGGLLREWFLLVTQELFDPQCGLFVAHGEDSSYSINPVSGICNDLHLKYFRFAGRFIGKALLEHQTLPAYLSLPMLKHILSVPITFSDLEFVDGEMYQNLMYLRNNDGAEALCLNFTVFNEHLGIREEHELTEGGAGIDVTDSNKEKFLHLLFKYRMLDSVSEQLWHLLNGLYEVIPKDRLSVFDYQELELLISGVPSIDMDDWHRHTRYVGLYKTLGAKHPVILWFWEVVEKFSHEEKCRLLQFSTGTARLPAQGFKALEANDGNFRLFTVAGLDKSDCLYPRSHTCFNRIDLPVYDSKEELEGYLSLVINMEITGFQID